MNLKSKLLNKIIEEDKKYLFQNYGDRLPVCFTHGKNAFLYDQDNKEYIDFFSGIAVSNLGYDHKQFSKALQNQIHKVIHTSNWYYNAEQIEAAKLISQLSFEGKTLFINSGTEANEAAIKLARKYGISQSKEKYQIISFTNSFHGRTMGSLAATAQKKIRNGFGPILKGFKYLPFNNIEKFKKEVETNNNISAIIIELIQGEGGILLADKKFITEVFKICKEKNILTIVDEVQTGIGRTGKVFAYEHYNVKPDMITMAKGLGGGFPIGVLHTKSELSEFLDRGSHGSTFGGNHLACTAATAVLKELKKKNFLSNTNKISNHFFSELKQLKEKTSIIKEIRGIGLHIGIELTRPGFDIVKKALKEGLIINCTAENTLRIMPPLNISMQAVKKGMKIFEEIINKED